MKYETVEVPFKTVGNRQVLTDQQLIDEPWLNDFFVRFKHCFIRSEEGQFWVYEPSEKS